MYSKGHNPGKGGVSSTVGGGSYTIPILLYLAVSCVYIYIIPAIKHPSTCPSSEYATEIGRAPNTKYVPIA